MFIFCALWCLAQRARVSVSNVHALQLIRARLGNLEGCFVEKRFCSDEDGARINRDDLIKI